jgi:hypothetical protein
MAVAIPYPLINGTRHDFSSIELKLGRAIFVGFRSINYKRTRSRTKVRGNHPDPIAKTQGSNEYTCDFEVYLAEWKALKDEIKTLAAQQGIPSGSIPGSGYGDALFQIVVTYGSPLFDVQTDTIYGATLDEVDASQSRSDDPLIRKVNCDPLKIIYDDDDDVGSTLTAPPTT